MRMVARATVRRCFRAVEISLRVHVQLDHRRVHRVVSTNVANRTREFTPMSPKFHLCPSKSTEVRGEPLGSDSVAFSDHGAHPLIVHRKPSRVSYQAPFRVMVRPFSSAHTLRIWKSRASGIALHLPLY